MGCVGRRRDQGLRTQALEPVLDVAVAGVGFENRLVDRRGLVGRAVALVDLGQLVEDLLPQVGHARDLLGGFGELLHREIEDALGGEHPAEVLERWGSGTSIRTACWNCSMASSSRPSWSS